MIKKEIAPALAVLKKIKPSQLPENGAVFGRKDLIRETLQLIAEQRKFEAEIADLREAHLSAYEDELVLVARLEEERDDRRTSPERAASIRHELNDEHADFLRAIAALNRAVAELGKEPAGVGLLPYEALDALTDAADLDLAAVEALYPLFNS